MPLKILNKHVTQISTLIKNLAITKASCLIWNKGVRLRLEFIFLLLSCLDDVGQFAK